MTNRYLANLTWTDVEALLPQNPLVVIPTGATETSMILATHPHLVTEPLPTETVPFNLGFVPYTTSVFPRIKTVSPNGYLGTPSHATAKEGHRILDLAADKLATILQTLP